MTSAVMDDVGDGDDDEREKPETTVQSSETINVEQYTPHVNNRGEWLLSDIDLGVCSGPLSVLHEAHCLNHPIIRVDF
jgi:hypothetical protein